MAFNVLGSMPHEWAVRSRSLCLKTLHPLLAVSDASTEKVLAVTPFSRALDIELFLQSYQLSLIALMQLEEVEIRLLK